MTTTISSDNISYNYNYKKDIKGGGIAALLGGTAIELAQSPVNMRLLKSIDKTTNFSESEIANIQEAGEKILEKQGLKAKGVTIKYLPYEMPTLEEYLKFPPMYSQIKMGMNAGFANTDVEWYDFEKGEKIFIEKRNTVLMPEKNLQNSLFHEIGHAHTFNYGGIMKFMQKLRPIGMLLPTFLLFYGAFSKKSKPQNPDTELTKKQKVNNFIRDNAGKLTFAAMLPILIEEAAATIKGNKFAKEFLSGDMAKRALKGNTLAYMTYLGTAIVSSLAAMAAVKIKDKKIAKKEDAMQRKIALIQSYQSSL